MKKLFLLFMGAWFAVGPAQAAETSKVFSDDTFTVAATLKLGRTEGVLTSSAPQRPNHFPDQPCVGCGGGGNKPATECADNEKLVGRTCVNACQGVTKKTGEICQASNHECQCGKPCDLLGGKAECAASNKLCINSSSTYTCKSPCEFAGKICTAQGLKCVESNSQMKCVECTADSDCASGLKCGTDNVCIPADPCYNVKCDTGKYCVAGLCRFYALGSTKDPQCASNRVADGQGGCKNPCDGVKCPIGKICTPSSDGSGKACCGNCGVVAIAKLGSRTNISKDKVFLHPKLRICLPKVLQNYEFKKLDFVSLKDNNFTPSPWLYTDLGEVAITDTNLVKKTIPELIVVKELTPATVTVNTGTSTLISRPVNTVVQKAVTSTSNDLIITPADRTSLQTIQLSTEALTVR